MTLGRQLFRRNIAEALAELLGQRYSTAKQLARAVDIDPSTAENMRKGHLSVPTLQKVLDVEGRALWEKLGDELFGETFYQFEERRIAAAIREAQHAQSNLVRLRAQGSELLASAGLMDPPAVGRAPVAVGRGEGGPGRADHDQGFDALEGQGDRGAARPVETRPPVSLWRVT